MYRRRGLQHPCHRVANGARRGRAGGCRPAFDRERYKQRNVVERCFNCLKQMDA